MQPGRNGGTARMPRRDGAFAANLARRYEGKLEEDRAKLAKARRRAIPVPCTPLCAPVNNACEQAIRFRSHFLKKVVDTFLIHWHNNRCCLEVRHYLSWIEGLTTNQYAGGSNPSWRTISAYYSATIGSPTRAVFLLLEERSVLEGSKT